MLTRSRATLATMVWLLAEVLHTDERYRHQTEEYRQNTEVTLPQQASLCSGDEIALVMDGFALT